jgi:hypothetical protein
MDLKKLKNQWAEYCAEFENSEEMDIEKHINMASKVGSLLMIITEKQKGIENHKKYIGQLQHENMLLYGRLNQIRDLTNKKID